MTNQTVINVRDLWTDNGKTYIEATSYVGSNTKMWSHLGIEDSYNLGYNAGYNAGYGCGYDQCVNNVMGIL